MLKLIRRGVIILFLVAVVGYPVWFALNNPKVEIHYFIGLPSIEIALVWVLLGAIVVVAPFAFLAGFLPTSVGKSRLSRQLRKSRTTLGGYREGMQNLLKKDYRRARKRLTRVLAEAPPDPAGHMALAEVHLAEGKPEEALAVLRKAKEGAPADLRILMQEARVYRRMGDLKRALDVLRGIVVELGPSLGVLEEQRDVLIAMGEWDEAYRVQKNVLQLLTDADDEDYEKEEDLVAWLRYEYARSLMAAGRTEDAEDILKTLQKKKKRFAPAAVALGDLYASQGRDDTALQVWEKGYWASPHPVLLERMDDAAVKFRKSEEIVKLYKNIMKEWPEDRLVKLRYARLCLKLDRAEDALAQIEEIERSGVGGAEIAVLKGEAYARLKRPEQAIEQFRKAVPLAGSGYACEACHAPATRWEASCKACQRWGTVRSADERALAGAKTLVTSATSTARA